MFDLGALISLVAQDKSGQLASQLDAMGIPPPNDQIMKLGMKPAEPLFGAGTPTGPTTNLNNIIKDSLGKAVNGPEAPPFAGPGGMSGTSGPIPQVNEMPNGGMTIPPPPNLASGDSGPVPEMPSGGMLPGLPQPIGLGAPPPGALPPSQQANPAADTSANGQAGPGASPNSNMMAALAGLKGVGQPVQPFTHGGVVGGVKAPEMHPANPAVISGIIQMLMHPHASGVQTGPSLGQLIR